LLGEYMAGHVEEEDGARAIREYWNSYAQASAIPDGMNVEEADQPEYIHLADTRLYHHSGKAIPNNDTVLWRGRLSDISGFYFGALSNED